MGEKVVPDTSIIIDGKLSELIQSSTLAVTEVVVPNAVLDELQAQASKGQEVGFVGLAELKRVQSFGDDKGVKVRFVGDRPSLDEIKLARSGRIDSLIMDVARSEGATLLTADYVQALVAEAKGIKVQHIRAEIKTTGLAFEKFLTPDTLSVHLKEGVAPMAKRGRPGKLVLERLREEPGTAEELNMIVREMFDAIRVNKQGFIEINRSGASVLQLGDYRIAVARPPFSDGLEVTIVRPVVKLDLESYRLSEKLMTRLREKSEGMLIAGPPGSGKTTFASSIAEFTAKFGKVVKTLESPRDLQVGPEITQYGPLEGDFAKTADILLLVRPDFTVFDEIRKSNDFQVFADMRLAGVGMLGVVHASHPIDAIQRFMGRVELGLVPHIIDTVIFIEGGQISKIYELNLTVKVPTGMIEADLARPLVEVTDFESGKLEYEIYTYGEENVIIPVKPRQEQSPAQKLATEQIRQEIDRFDPAAEIHFLNESQITVRVENTVIPLLIGKSGTTISKIERKLGLKIDVEPRVLASGEEVTFNLNETGKKRKRIHFST